MHFKFFPKPQILGIIQILLLFCIIWSSDKIAIHGTLQYPLAKFWVLCCVYSCRHVIWKLLNLPSALQKIKMFKETFYLFEVGYKYELQACW